MRAQRRQHDFVHNAGAHRGVDDRRRRIGAHAAGIRSLVAIEGALVILRRSQRERGRAVAEREERGLLAVKKFLDDQFGAGLTEAAAQHHVDRGFRFGQSLRDDHALAGRQSVGLDDDAARRGRGHRLWPLQRRRKRSYAAVGMRLARHRSLVKPLEPSSCAAARLGPKALMPAASRSSTIPAQSGVSGPTTTRSMPLLRQNPITAAWSAISSATHSASRAIPALPGAQNRRS